MSRQQMTEHPKQHEILRYIIDYKTDHEGASPTRREIRRHAGWRLHVRRATTCTYLYRIMQSNCCGTKDIRVNGGSWEMM